MRRLLTLAFFTTLALSLPAQMITTGYRSVFAPVSAPACSGYTVQFKSTTPTGGDGAAVSTWNDTSGHGNNADFSAAAYALTIATGSRGTPNGTQSIHIPGGANGWGVLHTTLDNSPNIMVCAVYKDFQPTVKGGFVANTSTGAFTYYPSSGSGSYTQGVDESYVAGIGSGTVSDSDVWQTSCVVWAHNSSLTFYRWDGTNAGIDPTAAGASLSVMPSVGINQIFANYVNPFIGYAAELVVITGTTTVTPSAFHACAVTTYGVP